MRTEILTSQESNKPTAVPVDPAEKYRPAVEERRIGGRTEPGTIEARTRFLYNTGDVEPGRRQHAFTTGGAVIASDWPEHWKHDIQHVDDHVARAIASFGDDADLVITVARREPTGA